jgi:hypothetical protein
MSEVKAKERADPAAPQPAAERSPSTCAQCGSDAHLLEDGGCARCRSLVAARTLPLGISAEHRLAISRAEVERGEIEAPGLRVDPLIGLVVADRYRIVEALGRGGMGIVYKVEHTRIGKLLAMKLLTGELSRNPDVVRRFKPRRSPRRSFRAPTRCRSSTSASPTGSRTS